MICAFCGQTINPDYVGTPMVVHEVTGWEGRQSKGGNNALRLRRRTDRVAHLECVNKERRSVSANQGSLL